VTGRDVRCADNSQTPDAEDWRSADWDYVCTFIRDPQSSETWYKVGVRVGSKEITRVSRVYELDARYINK
jgi:hypothetical protein